jgi:hypothetical protein
MNVWNVKMKLKIFAAAVSSVAILTACQQTKPPSAAVMASPPTTAAVPSEAQVRQIAEDAYIYGYSLITTEVTRVQMSNVAQVEALRAPTNTFFNVKRYPPGDYRGVSAPNADTLYSVAWMDLGKEPLVLSTPNMGKRFFLLPMYSLWMPVVDVPGSRTTGEKPGHFLISGPGWSGTVPEGMKQIKSPTRYMVILGRTYADGTAKDYKIVNALQDQYKLVPLSSFGKPYTYVAPPVDPNPGFSMTDKPQQVIEAMGSTAYFNLLAKLMGSSAPSLPGDEAIVARMATIGIVPGKPFAAGGVASQQALDAAAKGALAKIYAGQISGTVVNGWQIPAAAGAYGTDYLARAKIAAFGWPANLSEDAIYPTAKVDTSGAKLNGANKYTLTFKKGETPPVNGFWSITMYIDDGGWWFNPNPMNKFTVSMRDKPKFNPDGTLTLYFQNESPGKAKQANWLPAPKGDFLLTMRMYWPKPNPPSILPPGNGTWAPPAVIKVD